MMTLDANHEKVAMLENREKLLRAARLHQLYAQGDAERAQLGERLIALVADLMISGGQKLKARSAHTAIRYTVSTQNS